MWTHKLFWVGMVVFVATVFTSLGFYVWSRAPIPTGAGESLDPEEIRDRIQCFKQSVTLADAYHVSDLTKFAESSGSTAQAPLSTLTPDQAESRYGSYTVVFASEMPKRKFRDACRQHSECKSNRCVDRRCQ